MHRTDIIDSIANGNDIMLIGPATRAAEVIREAIGSERAIRAPHRSCTLVALLGGGKPVRPGEVALADGGILFLEDLQNWPARSLHGIRAAHADGEVRIVRAESMRVFPACFQLVAHADPCPCGHFGDPDETCICSAARIRAYQMKLDGIRRQFGIDPEHAYSIA